VVRWRDLDLERRAVHLSGSLVPLAYLADVLSWHGIQLLLAAGAVLAITLEAVRLLVGLDWVIFDRLTRSYEQDNPAGYALAVVAAAIVGWAFAPVIAVPAILLLTVVDPIAGLLSDVDEVDSVDRVKSSWVMFATFGVALLVARSLLPLRAALPAAVVVVIADAVKPRVFGFVIDDNASIPLSAALVTWAVLSYAPPA
jgi:dolichol kinase